MKRINNKRPALSAAYLAVAAAAAAAVLSACGEEDEAEERDVAFYCTDSGGVVVSEDKCDDADNGGATGFWFVHVPASSPARYTPGQLVPATAQTGKFSASDKGTRTSWGLPASGRVAAGTVKTGIVGTGGGIVGKAGGAGQ